jgi:ribosomal protein L6P/L9E
MKTFFHSKQIPIQQSVNITKLGLQLLIVGPLGYTFLSFPKNVLFEQTSQGYRFFGVPEFKTLILTHYKLLMSLLKGVCLGFSEILLINGVG